LRIVADEIGMKVCFEKDPTLARFVSGDVAGFGALA